MAIVVGEGTTLDIGGAITQVLSVSFSGYSVGEVETTNLASTNKTFRASQQPDPGTMSATLQYDDSAHSSITDLMETPGSSLTACVVTFSDDTTFSFNAFPMSFEVGAEIDGNVEAEVELRISGGITIGTAA